MTLFGILKHIASHPLNSKQKFWSICRFAKWQISQRLFPYPIIYPLTDKCKVIIRKGMNGATNSLYCGLADYEEMLFMLHFLRKEDAFADIGANVGVYSVLAATHTGCNVCSFEPVPSTFEHLANNVLINKLSNVKPYNIALGSQKGKIGFVSSDTSSHAATDDETNTITVMVDTLDSVYENTPPPALMKIDVEGFESEVLSSCKILNNSALKAIMIELIGNGKRYGYDEKKIHALLRDVGFTPYNYDPKARMLKENTSMTGNFIYIRDLEYVKTRILTAVKVKIRDIEI